MIRPFFIIFALLFFTTSDIYGQKELTLNPFQQLLQKLNASGTLSGRVYQDNNANGNQDPGEPGLDNISVIVINSNNTGTTITTDANGDWSTTVIAGTTTVFIDNADLPPGSVQTEGNDPTIVNVIDAQSNDGGVDGYAIVGDISGILYFDTNGNGTQDTSENGIPDVDVQIVDAFGTTQTIETGANGDWNVQVPVGDVTSTIDTNDPDFPTGAIQTEGTNPTTTTITNGGTFNEVDGFTTQNPTGTLTGHLYLDENGNGTQDAGEADLPDIDIAITDSQNNIQTIATDANGDWSVTLPTGDAVSDIDESDPDFPAGAVQTEGTDPTTTLVVPNTTTFSENDGFFVNEQGQSGTLSGRLYLDENGNGNQELNEPGIASITIDIEEESGSIQTVETDNNGDWSVQVEPGEILSLIDENDDDFPNNAEQTEGSNPSLTTVPAGENISEVDGYTIPNEIEVFNALSPNGDGQNDFLRIEGLDQFVSNSVEIFNRNGVKVYETSNYGSNGNVFRGISDGRITIRKKEELPSGTYYYILRYEDADGNKFNKQGYLYIN